MIILLISLLHHLQVHGKKVILTRMMTVKITKLNFLFQYPPLKR
jgi:hypothetical protein